MRFLFIFFVIVPLVEMLILFEVADLIGGFTTIAMVVLTAAIGIQVLKRQGISTIMKANQRLESGEFPAQEIVEGMLLAAAGALLLTPGFITDTLGFIFLTAPLRGPIAARVVKSGLMSAGSFVGGGGGVHFSASGFRGRPGDSSQRPFSENQVFEGEFTREPGSAERLSDEEKTDS